MSLTLDGFAKSDKNAIPKEKLFSLIDEYCGREGFEVIKLGSFGTSILKSAIKIAAAKEDDKDMQDVMKITKGMKKMAVVDYEGCNARTRETFNAKLEKLLESSELLMEAKDGSDTMKIYGVADESCETITDFVMYAPSDCALICLFGNIPIKTVMELANAD